jgi:hypothetical protein
MILIKIAAKFRSLALGEAPMEIIRMNVCVCVCEREREREREVGGQQKN